MKTIKILSLAFLIIFASSCSSDDDNTLIAQIETQSFENLHAPQEGGQGTPVSGEFVKFNFATGQITTSETEWDIAFRGTLILVNGGETSGIVDEPAKTGVAAAYIASGAMATVTSVNTALLIQDSEIATSIPTGSGEGWYIYAGPPSHLITPITGKILVFRTHDGKYAKVEILSYYKDAPEAPDAFTDEDRYYSFNYVYQPNEGLSTF